MKMFKQTIPIAAWFKISLLLLSHTCYLHYGNLIRIHLVFFLTKVFFPCPSYSFILAHKVWHIHRQWSVTSSWLSKWVTAVWRNWHPCPARLVLNVNCYPKTWQKLLNLGSDADDTNYHTGFFLHRASPKKLKYGKPRLCESTLT